MNETVSACCICGNRDLAIIDALADLSQCNACRYVFVSPRPTPAALATYYSKPSKYDVWLAGERERDVLWKRRLALMARHRKSGTLLDVGAGIGQLLNHARTFYSAVYGTEISTSAIEIAKQKYGIDLIHGQLEELDFERTYDNIALFHILEHVPNPATFLRKCHDLLNPGGILTIAVPNDLFSWELKTRTWMRRKNGTLPPTTGAYGIPKIVLDGSVDEIHLSQFTPKTIALLCERTGFDVIESGLDPYFAKKGFKNLAFQTYYFLHLFLHKIFETNHYNTILITVKRK